MSEIKRVNYFTYQFLLEKDFDDEQAYHLGMRRRHNRVLHSWGVAEGLLVAKTGDQQVSVAPGTAVDREGREIVLVAPAAVDLTVFGTDTDVYLTVAYQEVLDEGDRYASGDVDNYTRTTERPALEGTTVVPPTDGSVIVLAQVPLDSSGSIESVDLSVRKLAGAALAPEGVGTGELANDAVTNDKIQDGAISEAKFDSPTKAKLDGALPSSGGAVTGSLTVVGMVGIGGLTAADAPLAVGDGSNQSLLKFRTEKGWKFTASGSGTNTTLDLQALTGGKSFRVVSRDGTKVPLQVHTSDSQDLNAVYLVQNGGNVGIGTTEPDAKLHVDGDLKLQEGVAINRITNESLIDSATSVPTENSVKTYVDQAIANAVPTGYSILGGTPTAPPGYSYTGQSVISAGLGVWSAKATMPTARATFAIGAVNGRLYAIGGWAYGRINANEEYDPATDTWTPKATIPTARHALAIGAVAGKLYAIGGYADSGPSNANEEYDPATDTWTQRAPMPTVRYNLVIGVVAGKLYAIGGYAGSGYYNTNEEYDPATDTWTQKAPMPTARLTLAIGTVAGKLYAIGGSDASTLRSNVNEEYDWATDTWTQKAPMPTGRCDLAIGVVAGKLYAIGGNDASTPHGNVNEEYDPATDTWTQKAPMPTGRASLAIGVVGGKLYAIGGYADSAVRSNANEEYDPPIYYVHRKN